MHKKRKASGIQASSRKPMKKVCDENESRIRKKRRERKNIFEFIRRLWKGHVMDINEPQVNDSGHNEDTICLVNG